MKVMIVTTPIRPIPTNYPPIGSLALIRYLRRHGIDDVDFYNIDGNRPSYESVLDHIRASRPDVLGISAVVSTAYAYTKRLSVDVKAMFPDCLVVVGGNLAASAEILLRKTGTDLCVLGEGERTFLNIVRRAEKTRVAADFADVKGLMLLDAQGRLTNTGYEDQLPAAEVNDVDWEDLLRASDIDVYMPKAFDEDGNIHFSYKNDPRSFEARRRDQRTILYPTGKGCVARCTFCHRWDRGMRYIPVDLFVERMDELARKYNVGFFAIAGENFGSDKKWVHAFCERMKERDYLWTVGAMRTRSITPELMEMMMAAGCTSIQYGVETGSARMLDIMEKKCSIEDNVNAMTWTIEHGMPSIIQLVIGMPGESPETIRETTEFCQRIMTLSANTNPNDTSINYAQALPGTPLYEFGRHRGLIAKDIDGEESYLLRISDRDAHDEFTTINFTDYPTLETHMWRPLITIETNYAYVRKFGLDQYKKILLNDTNYFRKKRADSGYFANPRRLVDTSVATETVQEVRDVYAVEENEYPGFWKLVRGRNFGLAMICYPVVFHRLKPLLALLVIAKNLMRYSLGYNVRLIREYAAFKIFGLRRRSEPVPTASLRRTVRDDLGALPEDSAAMAPLRAGR